MKKFKTMVNLPHLTLGYAHTSGNVCLNAPISLYTTLAIPWRIGMQYDTTGWSSTTNTHVGAAAWFSMELLFSQPGGCS